MSTRFLPAVVLLTVGSLFTLPAGASSQARIVRLSDVHGAVQINRNTGSGFERAFLNLPITQGTELKTLADGRAEVEFEDGSSLRLAPNSTLIFSALSLDDSGTRNSTVDLAAGMAYLNWLGKDDVNLKFSHETVALDHPAHFRVLYASDSAELAVFKGPVDVSGPEGKLAVDKNKTATFDPTNDDKSKVTNKIQEAPLDSWDKDATSYHDEYAKVKQETIPYGYGLSDLNYYGNFSMVPGYGMMWQPFFSGVGWDPFMDGAWGFYPGMGYMFASAYPWGWLPYRYGNWAFIPSMGWMWQPGMWNAYTAIPRYTAAAGVPVHSLVAPTGTTKTVTIGRAGETSTLATSNLTMRPGTAGMFIPRGSIDNMRSLNHEVVKKGFVDMRPMPQFAVQTGRRSGFASEHSGFDAGPGRSAASAAPMSAAPSSSAAHASAGSSSGGHH